MTLIVLATGVCVRLQTVLASLAHKPGIIGHGAGGIGEFYAMPYASKPLPEHQ